MNQLPTPDDLLPRVTIVVPAYGHWESLRECIVSLIDHASPEHYDVLIVNDCGPDADAIEAGLKGLIYGLPHFRYVRNPENLGFVRTCNRAAFELDTTSNDLMLLNSDAVITAGALDEMRAVLALSEHHGVVCPRSNDATIATIPFIQRVPGTDRNRERTQQVFDAISAELPRYYVAPVAIGFCFFIRRSLIENHGLFDEIYGRGYNEENDFCMRINALGYSCVIANHALVHHVGSTSFGMELRDALEAKNSRTLLQRYPFYTDAVVDFMKNGYDIVDRFSELLVDNDVPVRPKILIDLHHMSLIHNGSTRNAISFLELLASRDDASLDITIAAQPDAIEFFALDSFGFRTLEYDHIQETFDVGVALSPVTAIRQLLTLNSFCLRWVVSYLDIISLRSWALRTITPEKPAIVKASLTHADKIIAISQSTVEDVQLFFPELRESLSARVKVIHQGSGSSTTDSDVPHSAALDPVATQAILRGEYLFIVGNSFAHKQVREALRALQDTPHTVIVQGTEELAREFPDVIVLPAGRLSENDIADVYSRAGLVIFPTAYEGFGLPIVEAAQHGRRVLAFDTAVAREVTSSLGLDDYVEFFGRFTALPDLVTESLAAPAAAPLPVRTLADYNQDLLAEILATMESPVDLDILRAREGALADLTRVWESALREADFAKKELGDIKSGRALRLAQQLSRLAGPARAILRPRR